MGGDIPLIDDWQNMFPTSSLRQEVNFRALTPRSPLRPISAICPGDDFQSTCIFFGKPGDGPDPHRPNQKLQLNPLARKRSCTRQ